MEVESAGEMDRTAFSSLPESFSSAELLEIRGLRSFRRKTNV